MTKEEAQKLREALVNEINVMSEGVIATAVVPVHDAAMLAKIKEAQALDELINKEK